MSSAADNAGFSATRWTRVLQAKGRTPEGRAALADLCAVYYAPVHSFIRHWTRGHQQTDDLTQEFFTELLSRNGVEGADPDRGRFRSFLLGAVKHFLNRVREREQAVKRGGHVEFQALDSTSAGLEIPDASTLPPDAAFDKQWALTLLGHALAALEQQFAAEGKAGLFTVLKPWLTGQPAEPQSAAAAALGLSETAVKVSIHRLRQRFRQQLRSELAQTLDSTAMVEEEMSHLFAALS
ncbi:MAG TPA: sigma-70 family RNA polymerase sigma factor [Verrucomicrobiales bacterium]|jgi:RNA polymerase sigma-70 factor (ECF subfamily)|nr:sigma-70 family RNA polymerase sigma factor [Verrucomicrobiales bacterium]